MDENEIEATMRSIFSRIARIETHLGIAQFERLPVDEGERRNRELLLAAQSGEFDASARHGQRTK